MSSRASGTFDVKLAPQAHEDGVGDRGIGRMALDKQYHGDLGAVSKGQMRIMIEAGKHRYEFDYDVPERMGE